MTDSTKMAIITMMRAMPWAGMDGNFHRSSRLTNGQAGATRLHRRRHHDRRNDNDARNGQFRAGVAEIALLISAEHEGKAHHPGDLICVVPFVRPIFSVVSQHSMAKLFTFRASTSGCSCSSWSMSMRIGFCRRTKSFSVSGPASTVKVTRRKIKIAEPAVARKIVRQPRRETQQGFVAVLDDEGVILLGCLKRLNAHERVFNGPHGDAPALDLGRGFLAHLCGPQDEHPGRINRRQHKAENRDGEHDFKQRESARVTRGDGDARQERDARDPRSSCHRLTCHMSLVTFIWPPWPRRGCPPANSGGKTGCSFWKQPAFHRNRFEQ